MNGFEKNKNGTTKRNVKPDASNDQLGENANADLFTWDPCRGVR